MRKRPAFTLVELLVVIAVIAILVAALMPTLGRARDLARKAVCSERMKQFGGAISSYVSRNNSYPHFAPQPWWGNFYAVGLDQWQVNAWPKFYAVLEELGFKGTHATSWGVQAYFWEADEIWHGAFCPAMDAVRILKWANDAMDGDWHPPFKVGMHRACIGYQWNLCLRARIPRDDGGRWPAQVQGWAQALPNDNTQWIDWIIELADGNSYGAQAVHPQEVSDLSHVAEAWDSPDFATAPNVPFQGAGQYDVENIMPGAHWGPQMQYTRGLAMLNGARHPGSPNILYADGSVRADATRKLQPSELPACPSGSWDGINVNTWQDWDATFGTVHHIVPQRKFWHQ